MLRSAGEGGGVGGLPLWRKVPNGSDSNEASSQYPLQWLGMLPAGGPLGL